MTWIRMPALWLVLCAAVLAQGPKTTLTYRVMVGEDVKDGFRFELDIANPPSAVLELGIPFWAPGAYRQITVGVRSGPPAAEQLTDFLAEDETGALRPIEEAGARRYRVDAKNAKSLRIRWRNPVPGDRENNRSYLIPNSGLIDGPRSWLFVEGFKHLPVHVHFKLPEGWRVASGLQPTFDPLVYWAADYDRLVDCPTLVGLFHEWTFHYEGVPHRIVAATAGEEPRFNVPEMLEMVQRIVRTYCQMFGDVPYNHYTFLYTGGGGGGLEHLNSTTISGGDARRLRARMLAGITAHEFFHVWNVKRLRPFALGPFDYTGPVRVKDLWICEGLTSYYTTLGLWRAGLSNDEEFRSEMASAIRSYLLDDRSYFESSERSSEQVWDGGPLRYYNTGEVLGLCLDLLIRDASDNAYCLDDLFREMYARFGGYYRNGDPLPGYRSEDWVKVLKEVGKVDAEAFFEAHIRNSEPIDWNRWLSVAGLQLDLEETAAASLGTLLIYEDPEQKTVHLRVGEDSAAKTLGFQSGDRLLAIGTREVTTVRAARRALLRLKAEERLPLRIERAGEVLTLDLEMQAMREFERLEFAAGELSAKVLIVPNDTAYWRAGLRPLDVIAKVEGQATETQASALQRLSEIPLGETIAVEVQRGEEILKLELEQRASRRPTPGRLRLQDELSPRQRAIYAGLKAGTSEGL